ncbi:MAG: MarR family transcriptional regulator [Alteromonadales bacterium]|nr:MarR family transcriptional regulator [Alteromonadales bacterium]
MLNFNTINSMFEIEKKAKSLAPKNTSQVQKSKIYKKKIISFISDNSLCTVQQIAKAFEIRSSTVHNILVRLEASGDVVRKGLVRGAGTKYAYTFAVNEA